MTASLEQLAAAAETWLAEGPRPLILGLCGAQGSGKTTLAAQLTQRLSARGVRIATLSLDDLYLGKAERNALARRVHPLLATRGVPLTHAVEAGCAILEAVKDGRPVRLPRFDKAVDEPLPETRWKRIDHPLDLLVFEGWCIGAAAEPEEALCQPVNALEREEDADGTWRHAVNAALAGSYARLFAVIDRLVLLAAPGFHVVERWRTEQEDALRARLAAGGREPGLTMTPEQLSRFVQHYERITRAILADMPARADLVLRLDEERRLLP